MGENSGYIRRTTPKLTMSLSHSMMQRRPSITVRRVQRAFVLDQEIHHGHGTHGGGTVDGVLATFVADAGGGGGVLEGVGEELAGDIKVVLGGHKVDYSLFKGGFVKSGSPSFNFEVDACLFWM